VKVTFVGGGVSPVSGISQHTERLLSGLRANGCEIQHLGWRNAGPRRLTRAQHGHGVAVKRGLVWWNPLTWVWVGLQARRADSVGLIWFTPLQAPALAVVGWIAGSRRTFAVIHNGSPHESVLMSGALTRLALRQCRLLIAHVESVVEDLRKVHVEAPAVIVPLPAQIDVLSTPLPDGPLRLLHLGEVHRRYKGTDVLLRALALLRAQGLATSLTVAGRCRGEIDVAAEVAALDLEAHVTLLDRWVPDDVLASLFMSHHLIVLPYRSATTSGVVPIALAAGRPVVATRVGGLVEMVIDDVNGFLCAPEDPAALADAITRASEHRNRLARGTVATAPPSWMAVAQKITEALR
jgi:glycosyltransferase involved in cell wall biosynthesis